MCKGVGSDNEKKTSKKFLLMSLIGSCYSSEDLAGYDLRSKDPQRRESEASLAYLSFHVSSVLVCKLYKTIMSN